MGQSHARLNDSERKTNSSFSHDSDISLSTHSADFSLTPPRSRKAVSFQGTLGVAAVHDESSCCEDVSEGGREDDDSEGVGEAPPGCHPAIDPPPPPPFSPPPPRPQAMEGRTTAAATKLGRMSPSVYVGGGTLGRVSPGHDLGYHTLVTRQTPTPTRDRTTPTRDRTTPTRDRTTPSPWSDVRASPFPALDLSALSSCPRSSPRPQLPQVPPQQQQSTPQPQQQLESTDQLLATYKGKRVSRSSPFDKLSDELVVRILSFLPTNSVCQCARVCRRWYVLAWDPRLWSTITLTSEAIHADRAIKQITRLLARDSGGCVHVEKVILNSCSRLSDRGLSLIGRRCPELRHLEIKGCVNVTNIGIFELVTQCVNLEHLDVTGCHQITCIHLTQQGTVEPEPLHSRQLYLQYLDMTDCYALEDQGLKVIVKNCPQLLHLYLRRCINITDMGVKHMASYCLMLREVSVSDCVQITDFGMYELAKLGPNLRYLSVAKCDQISDAGIKQIARHCYKLRYLNVRGCEAVSDDSMEMVARSCPRLRALDIGKCDVTDNGMKLISEHCPNLKKLSVKSCDMITDRGVQYIAYYCRGLQQLNIQDCQVTIEGYRTVKKYCRRCIIEHTNPGFF
ncbi:F-box/LRR-repeat protein 7-like isoform X3 [Portunus trituberculatus]|uniref:F-box/LRR-repeat protein 7-like isoform X3 n=1 Tax=Portunus trituberculatus TaxID=210409 RepID=UPI001E1D1AE4|nr:F-box/LRR-repeat protein 7-like isoform X3 [Portunus trituberculatus]